VGYLGAGTVEFIVSGDAPEEFFFMEMNTRLQVEHPVTELIYGTDLVEQQLRIAAGEAIHLRPFGPRGHAVEVRVYAESVRPDGFFPSGGTVLALREPTGLVRVDSGIAEGETIGSEYDPMLSKIVAYGRDRAEALGSLDAALGQTAILGLATNLGFLRRLLAEDAVQAGELDTGLVERRLPELAAPASAEPAILAAAMTRLLRLEAAADGDPWSIPGGWRIGEAAAMSWQITPTGRQPSTVTATGRAHAAMVSIDDGEPIAAAAETRGRDLVIRTGSGTRRHLVAGDEGSLWLADGGETWHLT
jgi:acetyl-CoA/propionyl-CoA carboxylase biotin carboxyl carrier protein